MVSVLILLPCAPFLILWRAFVMTLLWSWFFVPTFGVDELSMPVAFGISLLVSLMTYQPPDTKEHNRTIASGDMRLRWHCNLSYYEQPC